MKEPRVQLPRVGRQPKDTPESEAFYAAFQRCLNTPYQPLMEVRAALRRILPQPGAGWWVEDCARHAYNLGFWKVYRLFREEAGAIEEPQHLCTKPIKGTAKDRKHLSVLLGAELAPSTRGAFLVRSVPAHGN